MSVVGGYLGARRDRQATLAWGAVAASANADTLPDLPVLRARSRVLVRNDHIARAAVSTKVTNVIGTGHVVRPEINAALVIGPCQLSWRGVRVQPVEAEDIASAIEQVRRTDADGAVWEPDSGYWADDLIVDGLRQGALADGGEGDAALERLQGLLQAEVAGQAVVLEGRQDQGHGVEGGEVRMQHGRPMSEG